MYKILFFHFYLFLTSQAKAITVEDCYYQGRSFSGSNAIDQACYDSFKISSNELFEKKVRGDSSLFEAHKNILWITRSQELRGKPLTGEKSQLNDIIAIALSSNDKLLAVLDQDSEDRKILVFGSHLRGHIKPYYVFDFPELDMATALSFGPEEDKIYFVSKEQGRNQIYSFKMVKKTHINGPLFLERLIAPLDLTQSDDYLFVLDRTKKVHLYTKELKWVSTIEIGDEELSDPHSIRFSTKEHTLYVSNKQGDTIHYIVE